MSVKHQLMTIAGVLLVGAVLNSSVMLYRLNEMSADARVVNQAGVVRGATQRLVKRELHGEPSDDLLSKIEKIISGLQSGSTDLHLPAATDAGFKSAMEQVAYSWTVLKETILDARENGDSQTTVYGRSEEFFAETDAAVTAAEEFAARKVNVTRDIQIVLTLINLAIVGSIILVTRRMTFTLHENISTLAATSTQIAATVDKHERVAADQATSMAETATTMEELDESSRLSASQAETGAQETSHSLALAEEGAQAVQQTVDAMTNLQAKMSSLSQQILALSERFDQIGELNTFVGELSNQTNLLAMNAAVEAAHAGQHGRGFAVVATEIRKLADQSGKSVSRIYNLVGDVQQAMSASVIATQEGSSVVEQATTLGRETAEVFKDLAKSVNVATESVQQLSLNNREQSSAINQIVEAVDSLNAGAREATSGIRKTSEDLHSLNQAVSNLQSMIGMTDARRGGEDAGSLTKIEVAPPLHS